jgi:cytochrome b6-f complex iron-sulfur subunit
MAEKKKMSVAEILAAARAEKGGGPSSGAVQSSDAAAGPAAPASPPTDATGSSADGPGSAEPDAAPERTAKPVAKPAGGGRPSVAEIMAMARAKKGEAEAGAAAAPPKPAAPKPAAAAAKPAAAKPAAKPAAGAGPAKAAPRDTASILAAARSGAKPGPVTKAEAPQAVKTRLAESARPAARPDPGRTAATPEPTAKTAALKTAPPMPTRPAKPAAKKGEEDTDRRGFLSMAVGSFMAVGFTALSVTGGLFSLGLARFLFPNVLAEPPSRFKVGFKEGFPAGKVETKYVAQYGVWVVNSDVGGQQQIYALKTVCTHLGCTPNWLEAEQKFKCPCHGSGFYKDGVNFEGPAPRPLERYAIKIADDGQLEVDKSRAFQEELGQWNDPSSFVPV